MTTQKKKKTHIQKYNNKIICSLANSFIISIYSKPHNKDEKRKVNVFITMQ